MRNILQQLFVEGHIQTAKCSKRPRPVVDSVDASLFTELENAARRWLDFCAEDDKLQKLLTEEGLTETVPKGSAALRHARETAYTRGGRAAERYGGIDAYKGYSRAGPWRGLLQFFEQEGIMQRSSPGGPLKLLVDAAMPGVVREKLQQWHLLPKAQKWLGLDI